MADTFGNKELVSWIRLTPEDLCNDIPVLTLPELFQQRFYQHIEKRNKPTHRYQKCSQIGYWFS